jgi:hypothetical protein
VKLGWTLLQASAALGIHFAYFYASIAGIELLGAESVAVLSSLKSLA